MLIRVPQNPNNLLPYPTCPPLTEQEVIDTALLFCVKQYLSVLGGTRKEKKCIHFLGGSLIFYLRKALFVDGITIAATSQRKRKKTK